MATFVRVLVSLLLAAVSAASWPAQVVSGQLSGSFTGAASDGNGTYIGGIKGAWTASVTVDASGVSVETVGGSGPIVWFINTSTNPMHAGGNFDGSVVFAVTVPFLGTISQPISVSGSWNAVLPINS